ncbi:crystal protein [Pleurotus eryngii]|uniref:Carboxylic ester hydrolase n=1 Tax=Pleurotus eryngii TaxID=5323 RepID=A0A9P6D150_PLEER|nr:crystal protein [Pleurotus eryngii]
MVALNYLTAFLWLVTFAVASPIPDVDRRGPFGPIRFPQIDPRGLLCKLPLIRLICPRGGSSNPTCSTPIGTARGVVDPDGANRYSVKYANADRWQPSTVATIWSLPNGSTNITALPLACPQVNADSSSVSEDCLSMILYVPTSLHVGSNAPTFVWIHGGSFFVGSANGPGLDGSKLAIATNSIVAVIQYRLGALGFMAPDGKTNLAVGDAINALKFLKNVVPSFGGSTSKITLAGQSAGATMVRALLAAPSASSLFRNAILHSDPMDFGFLSTTAQQNMQSHFNTEINCGATDTACHNALSLSTITDASLELFSSAASFEPSAGMSQPMRPVRDGSLITSSLNSASFPSMSKPVLINTVVNDAGPAIYGNFDEPMGEQMFQAVVFGTLGEDRGDTVLSSTHYPLPPSVNGQLDARPTLETMGTDQMWKCPSWTFARNYIQSGGTAYIGVYSVGATYPSNDGVSFCAQNGVVCHEDDIQIVFGTTDSPTAAQSSLTTEVQNRYKAFMNNGNPNPSGVSAWSAATSSNLNAKDLGGSSAIPIGACDPSFWGAAVPYDYQVYP